MILAPTSDATLRRLIARGALPEEDVLFETSAILDALERGLPRLVVQVPGDPHPLSVRIGSAAGDVPVLTVVRSRRGLSGVLGDGVAVLPVDARPLRMRRLIEATAMSPTWADQVFQGLGVASGRPVPGGLRGMGRRILEFPPRYRNLRQLAELSGLSRDALKARFRRRGLPSPFSYLRWFRVLAASRVLADPSVTTVAAAFKLGFTSSGNLCRAVQSTARVNPGDLRHEEARARLLTSFARELLRPELHGPLSGLTELFERRAA